MLSSSRSASCRVTVRPHALQNPQRRRLRHRRQHHRRRSRLLRRRPRQGDLHHRRPARCRRPREPATASAPPSRTPASTFRPRASPSTSPPPTSRKKAPASISPSPSASSAPTARCTSRTSRDFLLVGELGLDGALRAVQGMLPIAIAARAAGIRNLSSPPPTPAKPPSSKASTSTPCTSLLEVRELLNSAAFGTINASRSKSKPQRLLDEAAALPVDFNDVRGQHVAKRALEVAAAGGHNILMIGPPGSGKTMLAKRLPSILAPLRFEEALETTKIHSVAGVLDARRRPGHAPPLPLAAPHHLRRRPDRRRHASRAPAKSRSPTTACSSSTSCPSSRATCSKSCASRSKTAHVTIARAAMSLTFPARFMLAAAMNPCPCGYFNDKSRECMCTPPMIQRYVCQGLRPAARPHRHPHRSSRGAVQGAARRRRAEGSAEIRARVLAARERQHERFAGSACDQRQCALREPAPSSPTRR